MLVGPFPAISPPAPPFLGGLRLGAVGLAGSAVRLLKVLLASTVFTSVIRVIKSFRLINVYKVSY